MSRYGAGHVFPVLPDEGVGITAVFEISDPHPIDHRSLGSTAHLDPGIVTQGRQPGRFLVGIGGVAERSGLHQVGTAGSSLDAGGGVVAVVVLGLGVGFTVACLTSGLTSSVTLDPGSGFSGVKVAAWSEISTSPDLGAVSSGASYSVSGAVTTVLYSPIPVGTLPPWFRKRRTAPMMHTAMATHMMRGKPLPLRRRRTREPDLLLVVMILQHPLLWHPSLDLDVGGSTD